MWAAENGSMEIMKLLIERGADVNAEAKVITHLHTDRQGVAIGQYNFSSRTTNGHQLS